MFPRWSPTFLIFFWLVRILTMMDWWLNPGAFSLVLVEKSFLAIFSANHKVRLFLLFKTCVNLPGNFEIRSISQVEALHQLLVDHGILGSNPQRAPSPTSAGEVMLPKLWRFELEYKLCICSIHGLFSARLILKPILICIYLNIYDFGRARDKKTKDFK